MCEFCVQHGAGKKWYLEAQNYAHELAITEGRETYIKSFFKNYRKSYERNVKRADIAYSVPLVREFARRKIQDYFSQNHAGQVISLEDALTICSIPGRVSLIECPCQKHLFGKNEKKCILFGTTAEIVDNLPEFAPIQDLGCEDAANLLKDLDSSGQVHTVWTFKTPYIGAICNCNRTNCLLFHLKERYKSPSLIRKGHEVASVDHEMCDGCGICQCICQFKAINLHQGKAAVDGGCHGCGVCRSFCPLGAIQLIPKIEMFTKAFI